ncbi:cell division protein ZipA C-terminal FtsZ-binding domain-containing protein [Noviherbaspirillum pedocola]|uniref:Cell division protein ZipA n=1 Tax=Noviherbaspirillum pedocola TaxID=2801341 RepID=A0A934SS09_9BURK|nr:cell division protein ZipA C-terminal FtsZ-binding domain-containing protein [Noviherbaspirillum pedocola]MBK4734527.1 cell division protein [Noviherbaspirillum pedocola]
MTDLQASLIAIGGAIVVGVFSYNKWQEYKTRKTVERAFSDDQHDVLMQPERPSGARIEPGFGEALGARASATATDDADLAPAAGAAFTDTPHMEHVQTAPAAPATPARAEDSHPSHHHYPDLPVDQLIDCAIPLQLETPMRGDRVLPVIQRLRHVGNKPVHFIGLADDGRWESVAHGRLYSMLQAGVQLANRVTALNEIEYSEFVARLRQVADELNAECDVPDMGRVVAIARGLHQFVNEYGAQLSVSVQSNRAPWQIGTLLAALERQGFDLRPDGRLVMPDGDGGVLFSISTNVNQASETTTSRLTLLLDVALVAAARDGYGAMIACAKSLAARLDGTVVDDSNQPLSEATLAEIATQVQAFYADMESSEIPAGSTRAQRLFA